MINLILFFEFFKIGLLAIGGGVATIPFVIELLQKYHWISLETFGYVVAIVQSCPGAFGVNLATYIGFLSAGLGGAIVAGVALTLPSLVVVILFSSVMQKYLHSALWTRIFDMVRPAVMALILFATWQLAKIAVTNWLCVGTFVFCFALMWVYKKSPAFYIVLGAFLGILLKL